MKKLFALLIILLTISYPFFIYWGLHRYDAKWLLPLLLVLLTLRWYVFDRRAERKIIISTMLVLFCFVLFGAQQLGLKLYPLMLNLGFFVLFFSSLFTPVSFVEKLARIKEPDLPAHAVVYTRRVTLVWSVFFVVNGSISALTALYASDEIWMLYNGLIAYMLIGMLGAGEWLVRQTVMKNKDA